MVVGCIDVLVLKGFVMAVGELIVCVRAGTTPFILVLFLSD